MKSLSILVAEDDESIRSLLRRCLHDEGHQPVCVANGREAREAMGKGRFDLVITDVLMPERDGLDVIAEVKEVLPHARILAISGGGRIMDAEDCLRLARGLGAHAALMKPFNREELLAGMAQALAPQREGWW